MATRVIGNYYQTTAAYFNYTISTNNATTYTLTLDGGYTNKTNATFDGLAKLKITGTGKTDKSSADNVSFIRTKGDHQLLSSYPWSWTKTHSTQSITVGAEFSLSGIKRSSASKSFTIPARTSYSVTYNANSGTGAPSAQTKWHDESLTLSSAKPTKAGYTFKGWATSAANAAAGTVNYAAGATYSGNAALTLYAVWELTYSKPTITNLSVERCAPDPDNPGEYIPDDEGNYALVGFNWAVFNSASARYYGGSTYPYSSNEVDTCTVTVGSYSATPTLSGVSGTESIVVGNGSYDTDTQYSASVEITDTQSIVGSHTTTVTGTLSKAAFPMDFNATGDAVGFFMPAPDSGSGMYVGGNVEAAGDVTDGAGTSISDLAIDYIIEEGSTGDWYYRKWHSGRRECWAALYYANTAMTSAEGSGYYAAQKTIAFPTNFFPGNLTVNATAEMDGALGGFAIRAANKTNITGYFWATRSITKNVWLNIYAISR